MVLKIDGRQPYQHLALEAKIALTNGKTPDWQKSIWSFVGFWADPTQEYCSQKTSGSTGTPKVIEITKRQMKASAQMTGKYFGFAEGQQALLCMSADYIAGKMMIVRALEWKMQLICVMPSANPMLEVNLPLYFSAMVPYQVQNILDNERTTKLFEQTNKVLIGGAAVSDMLKKRLQLLSNECFASYGMTETVSHIAINRLNGAQADDSFYPLENIKLSLDHRNCLKIVAPHLHPTPLITNDLVAFTDPTNPLKGFSILGRFDNVVNSGGVKLIIEQIEKKIAPLLDKPFYLVGKKDNLFGEILVLFVEDKYFTKKAVKSLEKSLRKNLFKYEVPKEIYVVDDFLRTETGKVKRVLFLN